MYQCIYYEYLWIIESIYVISRQCMVCICTHGLQSNLVYNIWNPIWCTIVAYSTWDHWTICDRIALKFPTSSLAWTYTSLRWSVCFWSAHHPAPEHALSRGGSYPKARGDQSNGSMPAAKKSIGSCDYRNREAYSAYSVIIFEGNLGKEPCVPACQKPGMASPTTMSGRQLKKTPMNHAELKWVANLLPPAVVQLL